MPVICGLDVLVNVATVWPPTLHLITSSDGDLTTRQPRKVEHLGTSRSVGCDFGKVVTFLGLNFLFCEVDMVMGTLTSRDCDEDEVRLHVTSGAFTW